MADTKSSTKKKVKCNSCQEIGMFLSELTSNNLINWVNEKTGSSVWKANLEDSLTEIPQALQSALHKYTATSRKHKLRVQEKATLWINQEEEQ